MKFLTGGSKPNALTKSNLANEQAIMQRGSERELMSYKQPIQDLGISELIKYHNQGERFMYAAVSCKSNEDKGPLLSRLIRHMPATNNQPIPDKKLPCIPLKSEVESFPLSSVVGKSGKPYIMVREVLIVFAPLVSSDSAYTTVRVAIIDNRFIDDRMRPAKSFQANTNIVSKASLKLSYCFPRIEVDKINLTISRDAAFLEEGSQWGVVQLQIALSEMEFPIQLDNSEVLAVNSLPQSLLEDKEINPNTIDVTITEDDRAKLREMFLYGDIRDESEPLVGKSEVVKYAKSTLEKGKGRQLQSTSSEWDFLKEKRVMGLAGDNSVEPSEDGFNTAHQSPSPSISDPHDSPLPSPAPPYLKSAMKKPKFLLPDGSMLDDRVIEVVDAPPEPINPFGN